MFFREGYDGDVFAPEKRRQLVTYVSSRARCQDHGGFEYCWCADEDGFGLPDAFEEPFVALLPQVNRHNG